MSRGHRGSAVDLASVRRSLAAGLAANADGRPVAASRRFRAALRELGEEPSGGEPARLRARALLGLVMSDFELRADVPAALATLDEAESLAAAAGDERTAVAVLGQRGLLWLRAGDVARSLADHDRAVAKLDRADPVDACCILLNRGTVLLEQGRLDKARADLLACAARSDAMGDRRLAFKARHNLGYAQFLAGDLPAALATMAAAAEQGEGGSLAIPLLDRAQVLLEAGLVTEADAALAAAGAEFAAHRLTLDLAQVELARAECALLTHRPAQALAWAQAARRRLAARGHAQWRARAELVELRARFEVAMSDGSDRAACLRVARRAAELADRSRGEVNLARGARALRAAALVAAGRLAEARDALAAAGRLTGREPLALALALRAVAAELAFLSGRPAAGRRQVQSGHALLVAHRAQFGSVEAVTAAAVHGVRLTSVEVGAALAAGDALGVLDAVERGRATFAGPARVRPPSDPALADLLAELRITAERERAMPPEARAERAALERRAAELRAAARERTWQLGGELGAPEPATAALLADELAAGESTVVDLVVHGGVVHAVVLAADGPRLVHLAAADEVERVVRRVDADLHALAGARLPGPIRDVVRGSLDRGLAWLDQTLLGPVGAAGPLHLVAGGGLVTAPWGLLPSRVGRPTSVGTRLAPATARPGRSGVVAVAGPGLEQAGAEVAAVARAWPDAVVIDGARATVARTAAALRTAGVVHLAAHGRHEPDNPLFSWLRLADGPLFAHDLEGADLSGSVVVLSACEVGRATVRPGGEVLGLASVLLRLGAEAVVAALTPLRDDVAAAVAPRVHAGLHAGLGPARALAALGSAGGDPVPLACFASRAAPGQVAAGGQDRGDG